MKGCLFLIHHVFQFFSQFLWVYYFILFFVLFFFLLLSILIFFYFLLFFFLFFSVIIIAFLHLLNCMIFQAQKFCKFLLNLLNRKIKFSFHFLSIIFIINICKNTVFFISFFINKFCDKTIIIIIILISVRSFTLKTFM